MAAKHLGLLNKRGASRGLLTSVIILLALSTPYVANMLTLSLEQYRTNANWCSTNTTQRPIVVLGGGTNGFSRSNSPYDLLKIASVKRVIETAELYQPGQHVYLLGGGAQRHKEAFLMAKILVAKGIPADQLTLESKSLSTKENAAEFRKLFLLNTDTPNRQITLVSSATHIPRASKTFEKQGFDVCHHAVDFMYTESSMPHNMLPYVDALRKTSTALHEYIGLAYYWLNDDI